jgi:hypothetical protein
MSPGEDVHQRGFARAVLADHGVTSPGRKSTDTRSSATTPGKRFVTP